MKVKELIEKLSTFPEDMEVLFPEPLAGADGDLHLIPVYDVWKEKVLPYLKEDYEYPDQNDTGTVEAVVIHK